MAKSNVKNGLTLVDGKKFIATAQKLGLKVTKQAGNFRIEGEDSSKRMYVPTTERVHRIDLSGFTHALATEIPEAKRPTGRVTHWIDFTQTEGKILRDFYKIAREVLAGVKAQEPAVEQPAEAPAPEVTEAPAQEVAVG